MHFVKLHWDTPRRSLHFTKIILCSLFSCVSSCLINSPKKKFIQQWHEQSWVWSYTKQHNYKVNSFYLISFYIGKLFQAYQRVSRFSKSYNNRSIKLLQKSMQVCIYRKTRKITRFIHEHICIFVEHASLWGFTHNSIGSILFKKMFTKAHQIYVFKKVKWQKL